MTGNKTDNGYMWIQITTDYFVAGLKLKDDIVVEPAPILQYMLGWSRDKVIEYCMDQYWEILFV